MNQVNPHRRAQVLMVLGIVGFSLAVLGWVVLVLAGRGTRLALGPAGALIPIVGLLVAIIAWQRSASDLAAMARGDMDRSSRQRTRIARRLGKVGFMIAALLILGVTLILVTGYLILGPNPSGP